MLETYEESGSEVPLIHRSRSAQEFYTDAISTAGEPKGEDPGFKAGLCNPWRIYWSQEGRLSGKKTLPCSDN